jgi:hypothetical protein
MNFSKRQKVTMTVSAIVSIISTVYIMTLSARDQNIAALGTMSMGGMMMTSLIIGNPEKKKE